MASTALEDVMQTDPRIVQNVFQKESLTRHNLTHIPPVREKFQVFKSYFPNQSLSNDILPVESFNNNFRKYPGIHTSPDMLVHTGSERKNVILNESMKALESGLPIRETDLQNVVDTLEKTKAISNVHVDAVEVYDLINKLYRWCCLPSSNLSDFRAYFYECIQSSFSFDEQPIVVSAFNKMLEKTGKRTGDQFDITSPNFNFSRETACQMLLNMLEFQRAYVQSLLNPQKTSMYYQIGSNLRENLRMKTTELQIEIKEKKRYALLVETLRTAFRLALQEYSAYYRSGLEQLDYLVRKVWAETTNRLLVIVARQNDPVGTSDRMIDSAQRQLAIRKQNALQMYQDTVGYVSAQMIYESSPSLLELDLLSFYNDLKSPTAVNMDFFEVLFRSMLSFKTYASQQARIPPHILTLTSKAESELDIVPEIEPSIQMMAPDLALSESSTPVDYKEDRIKYATSNNAVKMNKQYFKTIASLALSIS